MNEFTKKELTVHKDGMSALAMAVARQWILDGKPNVGKEGVELWLQVAGFKK
jgi:hypothetical protein